MNYQAFRPAGFKGPEGQEDMPYLLTAGPVTTSLGVRLAALADWNPTDDEFKHHISSVREKLLDIAFCNSSHDCVLMPGPGQYAVEAALGALAPMTGGKTLVISNGKRAEAAAKILERLKRPFLKIDKKDKRAFSREDLEPLLSADKGISHVWMVHCETENGIVNPIADLARAVKTNNRVPMIDATASFGALPINMIKDGIDVIVATSDICLESIPGLAFVILKQSLLLASEGKSHSSALDLFAQWKALDTRGVFLGSPPTHAVAAFSKALQELTDEGGPEARLARYEKSAELLLAGMKRTGLRPLLNESDPCPIVQAFKQPSDPQFSLATFRSSLRARGFAIEESGGDIPAVLRIATAGKIDGLVIERFCAAIKEILDEMGVTEPRPVEARPA